MGYSMNQCGFDVLTNQDGTEQLSVVIDNHRQLILVNGTTMGNSEVRAGPIPPALSDPTQAYQIHAIVDHCIIELIVNNDTAFVVYMTPSDKDTHGGVQVYGHDGTYMEVWTLNDA